MGGLLGGAKAPPVPVPPPVAPIPDNKLIQDSQRKKAGVASQQSGRASTILTADNGTTASPAGGTTDVLG